MKSRLALRRSLGRSCSSAPGRCGAPPTTQCAPAANYPAATTPVAFWSTEARCAIVPAGPGGDLRRGELRQQVPGRGGRVHGHRPRRDLRRRGGDRGRLPAVCAHARPRRADASPEAAIATAAYDTLTGLQPQLGANQAILDGDYAAYLAAIPDGHGEGQTGSRSASRSRRRCSRCARTTAGEQHHARRPRPARARPRRLATRRPGPVLGLRLPGMRPLALTERLAVPARRPQLADEPGVRRRLQPGQGPRPRRQHRPGRRSRRPRRASGPTTTSGSGTTACSASPPPAASTSCRPPGCWRWRTSPAATR